MAPYLGSDAAALDAGILPLPSFDESFPYFHEKPESVSKTLDPFTVNSTSGFLPNKLPIKDLPQSFKCLQELMEEVPVLKRDGTPGLLARYELGPLIDAGQVLPDLTDKIDTLVVTGTNALDRHVIAALYRDYGFLASSYLLEPCWQTYNERQAASEQEKDTPPARGSAEYGLGRPILPACIARPLVKLAKILDMHPFISYTSYALYNYYLENEAEGHDDYSNIRLIRAFEKGLDPLSSEAGFILTHIHMVALTGPLLKGVIGALEGIDAVKSCKMNETQMKDIKTHLTNVLEVMVRIEDNMERMWANSRPKDYVTYRTFIFGITNQPLFPEGVIYKGCFDDQTQEFRGESGANDSIIPLLDNLCQVPMPKNPLTTILRDFRTYRPESQRSILTWTESKATELGTRAWFTKAEPEIVVMYLRILNHIRSFRFRHWMFAREYIIKRSKYPVATGGSPIVTWLPNQLSAVMELMENVYRDSGVQALVAEGQFHGGGEVSLSEADRKVVVELMDVVSDQKIKLAKEVKKYCEERGV